MSCTPIAAAHSNGRPVIIGHGSRDAAANEEFERFKAAVRR